MQEHHPSTQLFPGPFQPEPVLLNKYQDFSDLPPMQLRKGIDDESNPWTPDLLLLDGGAVDPKDPSGWAKRQFAGAAFMRDVSGQPGVLDAYPVAGAAPFWVLRIENLKPRRKLLTVRLYAAPAGCEDEALAWTPIDKLLFEIEARQQAAVARRADLGRLFQAWSQRRFFEHLHLPASLAQAQEAPCWIFVAALVTDAELDHPENVCHCGSVQACNATAEGLDRRDPRYPFNQVFKHSIRTTFPLLGPAAMRMLRVGG